MGRIRPIATILALVACAEDPPSTPDAAERGAAEAGEESGRLQVSDGALQFGDVRLGHSERKLVELQNPGPGVLTVGEIERAGPSASQYRIEVAEEGRIGGLPVRLLSEDPPGSLLIAVTFLPTAAGEHEGLLRIRSDNPGGPLRSVPLQGRGVRGCVTVAPTELDFGPVPVADEAERYVWVRNCGQTPVRLGELGRVLGTPAAFRWAAAEEEDIAPIEPGDTRRLAARFAPAEPGPAAGRLTLETGVDELESYEIVVRGEARPSDPPSCAIHYRRYPENDWSSPGRRPAEVWLATVVELRAEGGVDGGEIRWTLAERPADSQARILLRTDVDRVRLQPDEPGIYSVRLELADTVGRWSESPCEVRFEAEHRGDLFVELAWETPGGAADLDLHVAGGGVPWYCRGADRLPTTGGRRGDAVAEVVRIGDAPAEERYRIAAHVFRGSDAGPRFARVRIWVRGDLRFDSEARHLPATDAHWDVAAVRWPAGMVHVVDEVGFPPLGPCP